MQYCLNSMLTRSSVPVKLPLNISLRRQLGRSLLYLLALVRILLVLHRMHPQHLTLFKLQQLRSVYREPEATAPRLAMLKHSPLNCFCHFESHYTASFLSVTIFRYWEREICLTRSSSFTMMVLGSTREQSTVIDGPLRCQCCLRFQFWSI